MDGYMPGPPFWFAAAVCVAAVVTAAVAALRPSEGRQKALRSLCAATAFAAITSFLFGTLNGIAWLRHGLRRGPVPTDAILESVAHALAPLAMGAATLTIAWLLATVARRRPA